MLAVVVALVLYLPSLRYSFVRDDHELIGGNPFLRRDGWLVRLLTSDFWGSSGRDTNMWRPLVTLSFWTDGRAFGWDPSGFHLMNVLGHAATSGLVAIVAVAAGVAPAAATVAAVWFASAPMHVESVAWISGRTDIYCALFFLMALGLDASARRKGASYPGVLAPVSLLLALFSKEAALPFVAVVAAAEWCARRTDLRAAARWLAPYLAVTIVYLFLHQRFSAKLPPPIVDPRDLPLLKAAGWLMLPQYLACLWPGYPHSPDIALALPAGLLSPEVWVGIAVLAVVGLLVVLGLRRRSAWVVPALVFVLPVLALMALAWGPGYMTFAERLAYLPSVGIALLVALGLDAARSRSRTLGIATLGLAGALIVWGSAVTVRLVPDWRDDSTMFHAMTVVQPKNARARIGWANELADRGRVDEALEQLAVAERLDARLSEIPASRALIHFRRGEWERVLGCADSALVLESTNPQARLLRATALLRLRRLDEAAALLEQMMAQSPGDPAIEGIWGQVLLLKGDPARAIPFLERAVRWHEDDPSTAYALGVARQLTGRWEEARDAFAATVRIDPEYYEGWLRLATVCDAAGDPAARDAALARARVLPEARDGRAETLARQFARTSAPR